MRQDLLKNLAPGLMFLITERGFTLDAEETLGELGRSRCLLSGAAFRIEVFTDRGDVMIDIASPIAPSTWFDLALVKFLVEGRNLIEPTGVEQLVSFLERHYSTVERLFSPQFAESTAEKLERLGYTRVRQVFPPDFFEN